MAKVWLKILFVHWLIRIFVSEFARRNVTSLTLKWTKCLTVNEGKIEHLRFRIENIRKIEYFSPKIKTKIKLYRSFSEKRIYAKLKKEKEKRKIFSREENRILMFFKVNSYKIKKTKQRRFLFREEKLNQNSRECSKNKFLEKKRRGEEKFSNHERLVLARRFFRFDLISQNPCKIQK